MLHRLPAYLPFPVVFPSHPSLLPLPSRCYTSHKATLPSAAHSPPCNEGLYCRRPQLSPRKDLTLSQGGRRILRTLPPSSYSFPTAQSHSDGINGLLNASSGLLRSGKAKKQKQKTNKKGSKYNRENDRHPCPFGCNHSYSAKSCSGLVGLNIIPVSWQGYPVRTVSLGAPWKKKEMKERKNICIFSHIIAVLHLLLLLSIYLSFYFIIYLLFLLYGKE